MKTNCPNCGAPIEKLNDKCAYCGTLYYDLSLIDFDSKEPFFLTIKKNGMLITQKVRPETADMTITSESVYAMGRNERLMSFTTSTNVETNIQFTAIPNEKNNHYVEMRKIENGYNS